MLIISNLTKSYQHIPVLQNVSLTAKKGEIILLLGSSGAGKSTLLRILCALESCDSGSLSWNNVPLTRETIRSENITGMVFQGYNLFTNLTVEQNLTLPLEKVTGLPTDKAKEKAHYLLSKYKLLDKKDSPVQALSGGQKQRVALVRTIAVQPAIICMDEPTSALDPTLSNFVAQSITDLAHNGYIIIIATHDTNLVQKLTSNLYLMENGTIIENVLSTEYFRNPQQFHHLYHFIQGDLPIE